MKKKSIIITAIILLIVFLIGFSLRSGTKQQSTFVTVKQGAIHEKVIAVGNITPKQLVEVKSPISGTVSKIWHDDGDYVKQGEPLLEVQPEPTPSDLATARQKVATDKVDLVEAKQDLQRYQFLLKNKAISLNDENYQQAKQKFNNAKLSLQLDQEQLDLIEKGKTTISGQAIANVIKSPIDGYILERNVDLGGAVQAESSAQAGTTLFAIANMNHLIFQGQVSEIDAAKIHINMPAEITVAALPKLKIKGELTNIALQSVQAAATNDNTGSSSSSSSSSSPFNVGFQVKITNLQLPKNTKLLAGYSATGTIIVKTASNVLIIPERALEFQANKTFVWIKGKDDKPVKQWINIGISDGMHVEIKKGLSLNEKILVKNSSDDVSLRVRKHRL